MQRKSRTTKQCGKQYVKERYCHLERSRETYLAPRGPVRAPGVTFVLLTARKNGTP